MTQGLGLDEHVQIIRLAAIAQGRVTKGGRLLVTNHRALSARGRSTRYSVLAMSPFRVPRWQRFVLRLGVVAS